MIFYIADAVKVSIFMQEGKYFYPGLFSFQGHSNAPFLQSLKVENIVNSHLFFEIRIYNMTLSDRQ